MNSKVKGYILAEIVLIMGVCLCMASIITKTWIWFDESFSINLIQHSFEDILSFTALDVHPPLYYLILKVFTLILGKNMIAYYLPSILCYLILIIASFIFCRKNFSIESAFLVSVALCSMPNGLDYALEIRMYSLGMLLVTLSFFIVHSILKQASEKNQCVWSKLWLLLAVTNTAAAYTHYFAGAAAVAISVFLLLILFMKYKKRKKTMVYWGIYCLTMFVLYLPWLPVLFRQMSTVGKGYWINPITEAEIHAYPNILFQLSNELYSHLLIGLYIIGFFLFLIHFKKNTENIWLAGCYFVILLWFGFGIGYSVLRTPILYSRYIVLLLPLFWLPICITYAKAEFRQYIVVVFAILFLSFMQNYNTLYEKYSIYNQEREIADLKSNVSENDVLFYSDIKEMCIQKAHFPESVCYAYEGIDSAEVFHYWTEMLDCVMVEDLDELDRVTGSVWVSNSEDVKDFLAHGWKLEVVEVPSGTMNRLYR